MPTVPTSSLLSTYARMSPLSHRPPVPFCALSLSRNASGPMTKTWPTSAKTSRVGRKESSTCQLRSISMYFVMSFVTMMPPAALTENFLKCSNSKERTLRASSVKKAVRFGEGERAIRASLCKRFRNVKMLRHVCQKGQYMQWGDVPRTGRIRPLENLLASEAALATNCLHSRCHPLGENQSSAAGRGVS